MAKPIHKILIAECPECESDIRFHRPLRPGQIITCPDCHEQLQVHQLDPLVLDWAFGSDDDKDDMWY